MPRPNPPVPFHQAQQLAAMGMKQDTHQGYAKRRWGDGHDLLCRDATGGILFGYHVGFIAAPDTVSALLWVLGSEAWQSQYGGGWTLSLWVDGSAFVDGLHRRSFTADTPADLLDAMLAAVKGDTDATP